MKKILNVNGDIQSSNVNNVLNLSSKELSDTEVCLLSKGLSFVPSVYFDIFNTILDVNKLNRSLTIKRHFKMCPHQDTVSPTEQIYILS